MAENFAELFQKSLEDTKTRYGDVVKGTVTHIDDKFVVVDIGLKSESALPIEQFLNGLDVLEVSIGDQVDVVVEELTDGLGKTSVSREKAKRAESWLRLIEYYNNDEFVLGKIVSKVKGGFTVEIQGVRSFLPGSLIDVRNAAEADELVGQALELKIIKVDEKRNNIVVSRRAVVEKMNSAERAKLLEGLEEGQELTGVVKNLTDYGAFVDLGGVDGLLHITDMSWKRIKLPSEVLKIGEEIKVKVLSFDPERGRVSLGIKQLADDPWADIRERYPIGKKLTGRVTNLADYGCFVELEDGVEGLVHMSEMNWTNKNTHPSKIVKTGNEIEVMVLDIDEERRRISLGIKQCTGNPWQAFSETHEKGERIKGKIRSITDFGIFVGLEGNIDGLVHLSDISWDEPGEKAIRNYKKGDEIEAVILGIDVERERVSLGIKQLFDDFFGNYIEAHPKGTVVKGKIKSVDAKQAIVALEEEVDGRIKASEIAIEKVDDATLYLKADEKVEAKVIGVNRKDRLINLSIRATLASEEEEKPKAKKATKKSESITAKLGDLLKAQISGKGSEEESE